MLLLNHCCCFFFVLFSGGNILEQLASDECGADHVSLVRRFLSACKDGAVKSESITVEVVVKG